MQTTVESYSQSGCLFSLLPLLHPMASFSLIFATKSKLLIAELLATGSLIPSN